jgi:acyl carrier protein
MPTIDARVRNIIAHQLGVFLTKVKDDMLLADDLGADSFDRIELIMAIEEEFQGEIPDEDAVKLKTVGDVIKYVETKAAQAKVGHIRGWDR